MVLVITFISPRKEGEEKSNLGVPAQPWAWRVHQTCNEMIPLRLTSLRWIKSIQYYKNGQEEYSK